MQDKSGKISPVNMKNGLVWNALQTSTGKIYRNRKKPERETQREGPKKTRFFRPDLPIRPITGFFRKTATAKRAATSLGPSHPKNATNQHLLNIER